MTHANDIAVLTALRDETPILTVSKRTPEQIKTLNRVIAHLTVIEGMGEEAKQNIERLLLEAKELRHDGWIDSAEAMEAGAAAITALAASEARVKTLTEALRSMSDAAEMLWTVLANVSGGDWEKQSPEWQGAAARWRDNYFTTLKEVGQ